MILTEFDAQKGILDSRFKDEITLKEIVHYINETKENASYPRVLKILTDATEAVMNFDPEALPIIVEANNQSLQQYDRIIDAIVLANPRETALSVLYQELSKTGKYKFQVFSTRSAATKWLTSF